MTRIAGILFDKDGTLFDFHATWGVWMHGFIHDLTQNAGTASALARAARYDLEAQRFLPDSAMIAGSLTSWVGTILPYADGHDAKSLLDLILSQTGSVAQVPAAALRPLLQSLRNANQRLGVATNDGIDPASRHLAEAGIHDLFDYIAGYDSGHGPKPGPGMLLAFARETGLDPAEVAMVGDSTHDLFAAQAAGMIPVAVLTGMADRATLAPHATVVLDDISALPNWLTEHNATA